MAVAEACVSQVLLFWDGGCPLCTKEIAYYKRIDSAARVEWVDLDSTPKRLAEYGLSAEDAMRQIHAVDSRGEIQVRHSE